MLKKQDKEIIEKSAKEMLEKMGFNAKIVITTSVSNDKDDHNITVEIESPDSKFIIGKHGVNLASFQYLLKILVNRQTNKYIHFSVDVNGYKRQHNEYLKNRANEVAREVIVNGRASILEPMNSYERRIIHLELENNNKVKTESIGENEKRKVIISPAVED